MIDSFANVPLGFKTSVESSANTSLVYMRLSLYQPQLLHIFITTDHELNDLKVLMIQDDVLESVERPASSVNKISFLCPILHYCTIFFFFDI